MSRRSSRSRSPKTSRSEEYAGIPEEDFGYFCKELNDDPDRSLCSTQDTAHQERSSQPADPSTHMPDMISFKNEMEYMMQMSSIRAAAQRACLQNFGRNSSIFLNSCILSFMLQGKDCTSDLVMRTMLESLPWQLRASSSEALLRITEQKGMKLMGCSSGVIQKAQEAIKGRLMLSSSLQFYIGISERPIFRFDDHKQNGYTEMWVYIFSCGSESACAERSLISRVGNLKECCNKGRGGERASHGEPHYLYIVWRPHVMSIRM